MYLYTIFLARMVGQGAIGQIGPFEFVLVIAVGSAAGDSMFYPDVGLLQGILVITDGHPAARRRALAAPRTALRAAKLEGELMPVIANGDNHLRKSASSS